MGNLRRYLIAGLLVWLPILATVLILRFLIDLVDNSLLLLPAAARPETCSVSVSPGWACSCPAWCCSSPA